MYSSDFYYIHMQKDISLYRITHISPRYLFSPTTFIFGSCCQNGDPFSPTNTRSCILYGSIAEKVHGHDQIQACLKFWLYSFICLCGLVSGPTRQAIRSQYDLPISPEFLKDQGENADCITGTIPFVNCFALCQDAREINSRNPGAPIKPSEFDWVPSKNDAPAATTAPAQAEMAK